MSIKIDVLMPSSSQYGVLPHFTKKLYEALVRQKASCRLLSGDDIVLASWKNPPDVTIGFNGALQMEDGSFFSDLIKVPHVACLVDPPYRFSNLMKSPHMIIACDDMEGCHLLKQKHFDRTVFMPHAVEMDIIPVDSLKREYDIVFLGTCIDAEARHKLWEQLFTPEIRRLMEEVAEKTLADDHTSFIPLLANKLNPEEYQRVFEEVELYIKGRDRLRLLEAFPGHRIDVFGSGDETSDWKKLLGKQSNIKIHPPVSFEDSLKIMQQSKIVLNSSIKNKLGAHERVFSAAACGAVVVTNDNSWMRANFKEGEELLLFGADDLEDVKREVAGLLDDESKRFAMAEAGRNRVMQAHTWDHRAKQLLVDIAPFLKA